MTNDLPKQTYKLGDKVFWIFEILRAEITQRCPQCKQGQIVSSPETIERYLAEGIINGIIIQRESDESYTEAYGVESIDGIHGRGWVSISDIFPTFNLAQSEFAKRYPGIEPIMESAHKEEE